MLNGIPFERSSSPHSLTTSPPYHLQRSRSGSDSIDIRASSPVGQHRKSDGFPHSPTRAEDSDDFRPSSLDPPRGDINGLRRQSNVPAILVTSAPSDGTSTSKTDEPPIGVQRSSSSASAGTRGQQQPPRHRSRSTVDQPQMIYFADPSVNRPQVAPGTVESWRAKMFRQKRDLAPRWAKLAGHDPSAAAAGAVATSEQGDIIVNGPELTLKKSGRQELFQNTSPEGHHNPERRASLLPFLMNRNSEFSSSLDVRPRSASRGISDFFRFRKKSVTSDQPPPINPLPSSTSESTEDRSARLQPPPSGQSPLSATASFSKKLTRPLGLRRQRSKSTVDPPKPLELQTDGPSNQRQPSSEPISVKVFNLRRNSRAADLLAGSGGMRGSAEGQRTLMGELLAARRVSPPEARSGFGIMEFLELYKNHATSGSADSKSGERSPRRKNSDDTESDVTLADQTHVIDQLLTSSSTSSLTPMAIPRSKPVLLSSLPSDLPKSIPEYVEVHHMTIPAEGTLRMRRFSPQESYRSLDGAGGPGGLLLDVPPLRSRRFSEPPTPSEQQLNALNSIRMKLVTSPAMAADVNDNIVKKMSRLPDMARSLGLQIPMTSRHKLLLWRDKENEAHLLKLPVSCDDSYNLDSNDKLTFVKLMKQHRCHELIPQSSMLVLLDSELKVIAAFYALMFNGIKSAPIWNSSKRDFVGMLTVTDFINVLRMFYNSPEELGNLEDQKISDWITMFAASHGGSTRPMVCVEPDDSLFEASYKLAINKIHRLLVVDSIDGGALYVLNYKKILQYIYLLMFEVELPSYMDQSIEELNIGTYLDKLWVVKPSTRLIDALNLLVEKRVSALPVVDSDGRIVNIYAKVDAINLAIDQSYKNLDCTVEEALEIQREDFEGVFLCKRTDSLRQVTTWIIHENIHRMIITDDQLMLAGIISLSDIVQFLVIKQFEDEPDFDVQPGDVDAEMDLTL